MELKQISSLSELLGDSLHVKSISDKANTIKTEMLTAYKFVGVYFSASWCPPCMSFLTHLKDFYSKVNEHAQYNF